MEIEKRQLSWQRRLASDEKLMAELGAYGMLGRKRDAYAAAQLTVVWVLCALLLGSKDFNILLLTLSVKLAGV